MEAKIVTPNPWMRIGCRDSREELDPVSAANITEFVFAVIAEVAFFSSVHLPEVPLGGLIDTLGMSRERFRNDE